MKDVLKTCIEDETKLELTMPLAVANMMNNFLIPPPAKEELQFVVAAMGLAMWNLCDMNKMVGLYTLGGKLLAANASICMDHVCWDVFGRVDEEATMRSLYFAGKLGKNCTTWTELCADKIEDCLNDLWPKLRNRDRNWLRCPVDHRLDTTMSAYWMIRLKCDTGFEFNQFRARMDEPYNDAYSLDENMFLYSFRTRCCSSMKYFWELLNEHQRGKMITKICEIIDDPNTHDYKKIFFSELDGPKPDFTMFFLRQLSHYGHDDMRIRILGSGSTLAELIQWPYDNSFLDILREAIRHHDSIDYYPLISHIIFNMSTCKEYEFIDVDVRHRRMFYEILKMNPKNFTSFINSEELESLWYLGDVQLLSRILRADDLKDRRKDLLKDLAMRCYPTEVNRSFLSKFMSQVLISPEERDWFIRQSTSSDMDVDV